MIMKKIIIIVIILGLFSCEKDNTPHINKIKPYKIISYYFEEKDTSYFTYNGIDPVRIESTNSYNILEYSSSKLVKQKVYRNGDEIPWLYLEYNYNNQNEIDKVSYYINVNSTVEEWTGEPIDEYRLSAHYAYEYSDNLITKEFYIEHSDTSSYNTFEYDLSGNISKKIRYRRNGMTGNFEESSVYIYTYDDKNHYLKDISLLDIASFSSKINNILSEERIANGETEITENTYLYNDNEYPILFISDNDTVWQTEYIEE